MKKKNEKIVFVLVILGVLLLFFHNVGFFTLVYTGGNLPGHVYSGGQGKYTCNQYPDYTYMSNYMGVFGDYRVKYNVETLTSEENMAGKYESLGDNIIFTMRVPIKSYYVEGFGLSVVPLNEGIPAQVRCDGTLDCNFGFTTEQWELRGDKCYSQEPLATLYRLQNNQCIQMQIKLSERTSNDYDTMSECETKIIGGEVGTYYRLSNNCSQITLSTSQVMEGDYLSLSECNSNLEVKDGNYKLEVFLAVVVLILTTVFFIFFFFRRRRR